MTTTVNSTIGSGAGRTYTSPLTWFDAIPADITAAGADQVHNGILYNDSQFTSSTGWTFQGKTTDAAHGISLRPAPGQGFNTNPSASTTPLNFNPSAGVSFDFNAGNDSWTINQAYFTLEGVQVYTSQYYSNSTIVLAGGAIGNALIAKSYSARYFAGTIQVNGATLTNAVAITGGGAHPPFQLGLSPTVAYLLGVSPGAAGTTGSFANNYAPSTETNCAAFGQDRWAGGNRASSGDYNATDLATAVGGAHDLVGLSAANVFKAWANDGTLDLKLAAGSPLIGAATPLAWITTDIFGNARSATAPSIGPYEYPSTGRTATGATTDGADVGAASAAVVFVASGARTDGGDVAAIAAQLGLVATAAQLDGADPHAAAGSSGPVASQAATDGADGSASSAQLGQAASSSASDGSDAGAAAGAIALVASSSSSDGADASVAAAAQGSGSYAAQADGADAGAVAAQLGLVASSAGADGADPSTVAAQLVLVASGAFLDGSDVGAAAGSQGSGSFGAANDGADVGAAAAQLVLVASSSSSDGADLAAIAGRQGSGSYAATNDGADVGVALGLVGLVGVAAANDDADLATASGTQGSGSYAAAVDGADLAAAAGAITYGASQAAVDGADLVVVAGLIALAASQAANDGADLGAGQASLPTAFQYGNGLAWRAAARPRAAIAKRTA